LIDIAAEKSMRKALVPLIAAFGLVVGAFAGDAMAESQDRAATAHTSVAKTKAGKRTGSHRVRVVITRRSARLKPVSHRIADDSQDPILRSAAALVIDPSNGAVLYEKRANTVLPIASITKLMTAMVVLDARQNMGERLAITRDDIDTLKGSRSRLPVGTDLSRGQMLRLALMASENRAASALSRHYPGGQEAFIAAMNAKARAMGLLETHFEDPTGLTSANVSSARDLARLVSTAHRYSRIREYSTTPEYTVAVGSRTRTFRNTNLLVRSSDWDISLSKTGYISEAGRCLVMQAWLANRPTIIVLLDSQGRLSRIGDANRIRRWIEHAALAQDDSAG
jgi:D-alanyl-D-alanine endopeptidase (penicillin-binding protein 7)